MRDQRQDELTTRSMSSQGTRAPRRGDSNVTERDIATPNESAPTSAVESKPAKKSKPSKNAIAPKKKDPKKSSSLTDDQKRLARNAALREWRKKNADRVKAYMRDWHAKRKGEQLKPIALEVAAIPARKRVATSAKGTTSKKSKKEGKG
jgi:hypothetical protein